MSGTLAFVAERQGALSADFRRYYGIPLREALSDWTARDFTAAVQSLPRESATVRAEMGDTWDYNHMAANIAELVDIMHYWLNSQYAQWTADPDAPQEKPKLPPPPEPLIPPVAYRPESVVTQRVAEYLERIEQYASAEQPAGKREVSSDEFDQWIDLL
ncbi:MAG: hypothetical protein EKK42_20380 [Pseudonocardiaceae bacterium]|nr:MAG: hypothetical protein EKK42_20380 [Pseudonocardiaceae bacterium]